ncbi:MAG: T9SS type A sorting domain-containing protein [Saprospiraceae bacterium]|nr:T9SS type A sorting domain-containing protein [Saprospiraceae bacterium]MBK7796796.1 T9SS type A sorting domain-containing protein [Saprospiraceae bacterium]
MEEYEMKIFDIYGRMIKQIRFNTIQKEIDLNLIPGIYHSIISSKNNKRSKQTSFLILSR